MKKVLILGGSSDIGIKLVKLLLKKNYFVYAHYFSNKKNLQEVSSANLKLIKLDFKKINNKNNLKNIKKNFNNRYDIFINLVGYIDNISYENSNLDNLFTSLKINSLVPLMIQKYIIKKMLDNNYGRILNCSSIGVKFGGGKNSFNYSISKHCMEFIPNKYKEWSKKNVLINNLRIGVTNTKIHLRMKKNLDLKNRVKLIPMERMASPLEISYIILNLIDEKNSFMTGQTITVSGGE